MRRFYVKCGVSARVVGLPDKCPKTTLCGHPKQGIQGTWNQSFATWAELGFLGSLSPLAMFTLRMPNFLEADFWLGIPSEHIGQR